MAAHGYTLHAVIKEPLGWEEFGEFVTPEFLYLDTDKRFYGPELRIGGKLGLLNPSVISKYSSASKTAPGNMKGDGYTFGSVFAISPEAVVFEHREKSFGDAVDTGDLMRALEHNKL
jgi:hypothetical protein